MKILFVILMFLSSRIIDAADCDNNETPSVENNSLALEKKRKQPDPESYTNLDVFKINLNIILDRHKKMGQKPGHFKSIIFDGASYLEMRYGMV